MPGKSHGHRSLAGCNGPKNEIYLDGQQALTFTIDTNKVPAGTKVWIGLSAPNGNAGSVSVTGKSGSVDVTTVMDMYYDFVVPAGGTVIITNNAVKDSGEIISVTNLKITGIPNLISTDAQVDPDGLEGARALFAPVTLKTIRMAANNGVDPEATDVGDTTDEPDPIVDPGSEPTTPSVHDFLQQLISNFISNLFQSISRLFGR